MSSIQPPLKAGRQGGPTPTLFQAGAKRSQLRLKHLGFDPIGELVKQYRQLELELEYQEGLRSGAIVELSASTGKAKAYRPEVHHAIYDKLIKVGEALLRYGYGRVPETTVVEEKRPMPLVVNLTKKGETYVINDNSGDMPDEEMDDDSFDD